MLTIQNPTKEEIVEVMKEMDRKDVKFWNNLGVKFTFDGQTFIKTHMGTIVSEIPLNIKKRTDSEEINIDMQKTNDIVIAILKASNLSTIGMKSLLKNINYKIDNGEIKYSV